MLLSSTYDKRRMKTAAYEYYLERAYVSIPPRNISSLAGTYLIRREPVIN